ncbi:MAG: Acidic repeat-containing protein, partial [Verrucomicrobiaceae bacterium]|nr:Acidic repeat-containing protein [Verrucomicrobiaceae bacterium]
MQLSSAVRHLAQLCFEFIEGQPSAGNAAPSSLDAFDREGDGGGSHSPHAGDADGEAGGEEDDGEEESDGTGESRLRAGRDDGLEGECRQLLLSLGIKAATELVTVRWNPRLRSTAGYAAYPSWRIELNPRLIGFEGQVERTLKHELAHLIAYHRAGRRRIEPHGLEWRQACADLGIAGEPAHHRLPFPRSTMQRNHSYQCPACGLVVGRVRPFKRATACLVCCRKHSRGAFDARFKFVKVQAQAENCGLEGLSQVILPLCLSLASP